MKNLAYVMIFMMLIVGCGGEKIEKRMEGGVLHVINPAQGKWDHEKNKGFDFELLTAFGKESEPECEMLAAPGMIITDKDLNVYVYDWQDERVVKFDKDGHYLWATGRKGQGPGEFGNVHSMVYDGHESIYVSNQSGLRIDQFNLDGVFEQSIDQRNLEFSRMAVRGIIEPDIFIVSTTKTGESGIHLHKIRFFEGGEVLKEIGVMEDVGIDMPMGLGISQSVAVQSGKVYLSGISKYAINIYNDDLELEKIISRPFDRLVRPGVWSSGDSRSIQNYSSLVAPKDYLNKYLFVSATWPVNLADPDEYIVQRRSGNAPKLEFKSSIDLFNADGEYLCSEVYDGRSPAIGRISHIDAEGNIYTTVSEPFPQVRKYRVIIKEGQ